MNLADSVKYVLKRKKHNIFTEFWRDDFKGLLKQSHGDVTHLFKSGVGQFKSAKESGIKFSVKDILESGMDVLTIFKVTPRRVKDGYLQFKDDFMHELDKHPDQKQKTIFILKVLGALTSFAVGTFYSMKKGGTDFKIPGLKAKNAFTQFLLTEIVFKLSQVFIVRFLNEVERQMTESDELSNIRYFKALISDRTQILAKEGEVEQPHEPDDRAIEIVDDLKNYIMTGKRQYH